VAPRTTQQPEAPEQEEEDEVTRPSDLGFGPSKEIEVDRLVEPVQTTPDPDGTVIVRMAETIEEFTYGNPYVHYKLEAGKQYRVPVEIARYLHSLDKIYHG
jgi:hypothetical protein